MDSEYIRCANLCILSYECKLGHLKDIIKANVLHTEEIIKNNAKALIMETDDTLYICWTGTNDILDVYDDVQFIFKVAFVYKNNNYGFVHQGFYNYYLDLKDKVNEVIYGFINRGKTKLVFTGHSLGASVVISALETALEYPQVEISCVTFGSPKIGDQKFVESFNSIVKHSIRIIDDEDIIPCVPIGLGYYHVNNELILKSSNKFSWFTTIMNLLLYILPWGNTKSKQAFAHSLLNYLTKLSMP